MQQVGKAEAFCSDEHSLLEDSNDSGAFDTHEDDLAVAENSNNYCDFVDDYLDSETGTVSSGQKKLSSNQPADLTAMNFRIHNRGVEL